MSAKGRRKGDAIPFEFFPTPAWAVHRLLDWHGTDLLGADFHVLEPTVGDGAIVRAVDSWIADQSLCGRPEWTGVELRRDALTEGTALDHHVEGIDFRSWSPLHEVEEGYDPFDLGIGNPPFSLAESIIRRALSMSDMVAMLLRVGILGSEERIPFWREFELTGMRVLPNRPSFDGDGTDSSTYAWFVWGCPGITGIDVLDVTPLEVRNAQKPADTYTTPVLQTALDFAV